MVESLAIKERNVYDHSVGIKIADYKITAIDIHSKPCSSINLQIPWSWWAQTRATFIPMR